MNLAQSDPSAKAFMSKAEISISEGYTVLQNDDQFLHIFCNDQQGNVRQVKLPVEDTDDQMFSCTINNKNTSTDDNLKNDLLETDRSIFLSGISKFMYLRPCTGFQLNDMDKRSNDITFNRKTNTIVATCEQKYYRATDCCLFVCPNQCYSVCTNCCDLKRKKLITLASEKKKAKNITNARPATINLKYLSKEELIERFKGEKKKRKSLERKIDRIKQTSKHI